MQRRSVLKYLAGSLAITCPICISSLANAAESKRHWGYSGKEGPGRWGELDPGFGACSEGVQQSPIDLVGATRSKLPGVAVSYREMPLKIVNNGHTIQVNAEPGGFVELDDTRFDFLQLHFHHPSEHLLAGNSFQLEAHLVHAAANGTLAVLGVFFKPGRHNDGLAPIWGAMPDNPGDATGGVFNPATLLPPESGYFRYLGSLTTPPCSQIVIWTVFKQPLELSVEQISTFASIFPMNARPTQALNRRYLLETL